MLTILNDAGFDGPGVLRAVVTADMPHHEVQSKLSEAPEAAPLAGDKFVTTRYVRVTDNRPTLALGG